MNLLNKQIQQGFCDKTLLLIYLQTQNYGIYDFNNMIFVISVVDFYHVFLFLISMNRGFIMF